MIRLKLYVAGMAERSQRAILSITKTCAESLAGTYELEIVDIFQQPSMAREANILAVPTLVRVEPLPSVRLVGDLSKPEILLQRICR